MKRTLTKTPQQKSEALSDKEIRLAIQYLDPDVKPDASLTISLLATLVAVLLLVAISVSVHFGVEAIALNR